MTDYRLELAPGNDHLRDFVQALPQHFAKVDDSIHAARNVLKILRVGDEELVVKSFQVLHPIRRFIYTFLRESKAKRSFVHSRALQSLSISTPEPVAYIEFFRGGLLYDSYYVSRKVDFDFTIKYALENPEGPQGEALDACAAFAAEMHGKGILHHDFSPGNLLIKQIGCEYKLFLVDVNRMEFHPLTQQQCIDNLVRMMEREAPRQKFMQCYARHAGIDADSAYKSLVEAAERHVRRRQLKYRIKHALLGRKQ